METGDIKKTLFDLENLFWRAMRDQDVDTATRLTDFPCVVAGSNGAMSVEKTEFEGMMKNAKWKLNDFELKEPEVRMLTDDVAVIAYKVTEKLTVDGKPVTLEATDASTWIKRGDQWLCAMHTESVMGDPYGRDRVKSAA